MLRRQSGFTIVELIVVIALFMLAGVIFMVQKSDVDARGNDSSRKQDMNAIYYYLEGVYYPQHKGYPEKLDINQLKGLDPDSLRDPDDRMVGDVNGNYKYEPAGCQNGLCSSYKLTAELQKEGPFTKTSPQRSGTN